MRSFWLHPITQIISYIALLIVLLWGIWRLLERFWLIDLSVKMMTNEILEAVLCVALLYVFVVHMQKRAFASTGIVKRGVIIETLLGFLLGFIVSGGTVLFIYLLNAYAVSGINLHADLGYPLVLFFFGAVVEEVIFRVFIFQTCERKWGTAPAVLIASTVFGLVHMINNVANSTFNQQLQGCIFLVFEAGFLLNAVYLINRRIWLPLGLHWAWNFFEGPIFGTIVSGHNFGESLLISNLSGTTLISGGPFGPEASIPGLSVGVCGAVLATYIAMTRGSWSKSEIIPNEQS